MRDLITIFRRELGAYFNSTIAYIFLIVFTMVTCGVYMLSFFLVSRAEMRAFFGVLPMMLVVFVPAITMRLWAEDRKGGTYELLLTFPMKTLHLVLGKFFASFVFYLLGLATTLVIPIMLARLGEPDWGPILGGYFGSILCGAFFISVGLFISGLCKDQIVAFVVAMVACFAFYMLGMPFVAAQVDGWTGPLQLGTRLLSFIAMTKHFESVERGLVDLRDVIYFLAMTALFLGLNSHYLDSRMRPHTRSRFVTNIVVYAALVIFVNVVASGFTGARFDLTK
ncbi:MAG: ABC transporter permease [Candidatus Hydrogenedentota bacterium]|nr:MAG: ABC transporter permease [Candidatus Hydrogenedentota bacterium]